MRKLLLLNDTRISGHHGSSAAVRVILEGFAARGFHVVSHLSCPVEPADVRAQGFDAVIVNGEGSMHGGRKSSHALSRFAKEASDRGVPVYLVNALFNEHDPAIVARMTGLAGIYCRESRSVQVLARYGIAAKLCPDLTFGVGLEESPTWKPGETIVVLDTTVAHKNAALHAFCRRHGIAFLPIRTSPDLVSAASVRNLARIARFNARKYTGLLFPGSYHLSRYSNAVRGARTFLHRLIDGTRVVVAGRFHGVCFCLRLGVPFLAIPSNTPKIEAMLADAGLLGRMLDFDRVSLDAIESGASWSEEEERRRVRYVTAARASIADMFDTIAAGVH